METPGTARQIVSQMYDNDHFSQWLGIRVNKVSPGFCELEMNVRKEMLNGFGIAHGGITYSLADSALAFASNSQGRHAVSIETSISHTTPLSEGDTIIAIAREEHLGHKISIYQIKIQKLDGTPAALFKGVVYRKTQKWEI
jgi:acyl-CoA thioesterase